MIVVMTTVADETEAERLAEGLVGGNLAACVQILPLMRSIYVWKGEVQRESENLLLIKTLREKYDDVERFILENHSYETPEIIAVSAQDVSASYLDWVAGCVAGQTEEIVTTEGTEHTEKHRKN